MIKNTIVKNTSQNTWEIISEKGYKLGTFTSLIQARQKLEQIEHFNRKKIYQKLAKNTEITETFSSNLRELNKKSPEKVKDYMLTFKKMFEEGLSQNLSTEELESAILTQMKFNDSNNF